MAHLTAHLTPSEICFRDAIQNTLTSICEKFPRVMETVDKLSQVLLKGFADAAEKEEKCTNIVMWHELEDISPEETWALAHMGFVMTRAPGDFRNCKVYAKPSPEYAHFYGIMKQDEKKEEAKA